jgi:hypothetical protein
VLLCWREVAGVVCGRSVVCGSGLRVYECEFVRVCLPVGVHAVLLVAVAVAVAVAVTVPRRSLSLAISLGLCAQKQCALLQCD